MPDQTPKEKIDHDPSSPQEATLNMGSKDTDTDVFAPDSIIDGKYKVLSVIGKGGMGTVYRVEQVFLHKEFALKTIHGKFNENHWRRFELEAQSASKIDHANAIRVSDCVLVSCYEK